MRSVKILLLVSPDVQILAEGHFSNFKDALCQQLQASKVQCNASVVLAKSTTYQRGEHGHVPTPTHHLVAAPTSKFSIDSYNIIGVKWDLYDAQTDSLAFSFSTSSRIAAPNAKAHTTVSAEDLARVVVEELRARKVIPNP